MFWVRMASGQATVGEMCHNSVGRITHPLTASSSKRGEAIMSCRVGLLGDMQQSELLRVLGPTDLSGTEAICKENAEHGLET